MPEFGTDDNFDPLPLIRRFFAEQRLYQSEIMPYFARFRHFLAYQTDINSEKYDIVSVRLTDWGLLLTKQNSSPKLGEVAESRRGLLVLSAISH